MASSQVQVKVATVDVFVVKQRADGWRVLAMRRAANTRCTGAWEIVHGRIESDERPEDAALRELKEETGLVAERLYSVAVHPFYMVTAGIVTTAVVFLAFVAENAEVTLAEEHDRFEWLEPRAATDRFSWPRSKAMLAEALTLFGGGDAGPLEDVLRVR